MKMVTLTNSFHQTEVRISKKWGDTPEEAWYNLSIAGGRSYCKNYNWRRTYLRVWNTLCGIKDCKCGVVR